MEPWRMSISGRNFLRVSGGILGRSQEGRGVLETWEVGRATSIHGEPTNQGSAYESRRNELKYMIVPVYAGYDGNSDSNLFRRAKYGVSRGMYGDYP